MSVNLALSSPQGRRTIKVTVLTSIIALSGRTMTYLTPPKCVDCRRVMKAKGVTLRYDQLSCFKPHLAHQLLNRKILRYGKAADSVSRTNSRNRTVAYRVRVYLGLLQRP